MQADLNGRLVLTVCPLLSRVGLLLAGPMPLLCGWYRATCENARTRQVSARIGLTLASAEALNAYSLGSVCA